MTSSEIVTLIVSQKTDEKKLELIEKYADELNGQDLTTAIASLKDNSLLTQTLIKYNLINNAEQVQNTSNEMSNNDIDDTVEDNTNEDNSSINDEEIMKYIKDHIENLTRMELEDKIASMSDIDNITAIIDYTLKNKSRFYITPIIVRRNNDDDKIKLVNKYAFKIEYSDLNWIFESLKDKTRKDELFNARKKTDDEIIKYIEYIKENELSSEGLERWIYLIKDIDKRINIIEKYKDNINFIRLISFTIKDVKDDTDKINLIEKYANKMDDETLTDLILSINDKDEMFKTIDKNKNRIIFEDIAFHFFENEENDRLKIMNKYADEIRAAIDSLEIEWEKAELKEIYNINNTKDESDKNNDNKVKDNSSINDEEIMKYIKGHIKDLTISELEDEIASMSDIDNIINIIDYTLECESRLFDTDIKSIIVKINNDDDKLKLVNKYAFKIDSLFEIYCSLKDKTRESELWDAYKQPDEEIIKYIEEHNSPDYYWITNLTDDTDKINLIEKYANKMDDETLTNVILFINDKDEMFKIIDKNKDRIRFRDIVYQFARRKEENDRLEIMNKYADEIRDAIDSIADEMDKAELKEIYNINNTKDESDENNNNKVKDNSSINDDEIIKFIEENELSSEDLGSYIGTIKNIDKTKEFINKYIDKLKSAGILYAIKEKDKDEDKVELIKEYKDKLGETNLWGAIKTISDPDLREEIRKTVKVNKVDNKKEAKKARKESKEKKKNIKREKENKSKGKLTVFKTAIAIAGGSIALTTIAIGAIAFIKHAEKRY